MGGFLSAIGIPRLGGRMPSERRSTSFYADTDAPRPVMEPVLEAVDPSEHRHAPPADQATVEEGTGRLLVPAGGNQRIPPHTTYPTASGTCEALLGCRAAFLRTFRVVRF